MSDPIVMAIRAAADDGRRTLNLDRFDIPWHRTEDAIAIPPAGQVHSRARACPDDGTSAIMDVSATLDAPRKPAPEFFVGQRVMRGEPLMDAIVTAARFRHGRWIYTFAAAPR
jgi:hypothetical protein